MASKRQLGPEVLYEFRANGAYCKVCAVDPETGLEAVIVGATGSGQTHLKLIALKKLQMLYDKKYGQSDGFGHNDGAAPTQRRDGSIIV